MYVTIPAESFIWHVSERCSGTRFSFCEKATRETSGFSWNQISLLRNMIEKYSMNSGNDPFFTPNWDAFTAIVHIWLENRTCIANLVKWMPSGSVHILTRRHFSYKTECHSTVTCSMITYKYWTDSICTLMHFVSYSKIKKGKKNTFYHRKSIFSCSESELVISSRTVGRYIKITIHIRFECSCELSIQNKA